MASQSVMYNPIAHDAHSQASLVVGNRVPEEGIPAFKNWMFPWPTGAVTQRYTGGCHCRKFRFEFSHPRFGERTEDGEGHSVIQCNCSVCAIHGKLNVYIPGSSAYFRFLSTDGENGDPSAGFNDPDLGSHLFNRRVVNHRFCKICGTHFLAHGVSVNPQGYNIVVVNVRTLDGFDLKKLHNIKDLDGKKF